MSHLEAKLSVWDQSCNLIHADDGADVVKSLCSQPIEDVDL